MKHLRAWAAAAAILGVSGAAQAGLVARGGGMVYDSTLNITWLADMNYAKTSGYDSDGRMDWDAAKQWAGNLVYGGYTDWRLPTLNPSDTTCSNPGLGFNCTGGELSHLFVTDLGNKANESVLKQDGDTPEQIGNLALFTNVLAQVYWSGTEYEPNSAFAYTFDGFGAIQNFLGVQGEFFAVAVRFGDVAAAVPEPQTLALAPLALGAAMVARGRRPT